MTISCSNTLARSLAGLAAALSLMLFAAPARANDGGEHRWTEPLGGAFETAANWDQGVPGTTDIAVFDLDDIYTVDFSQDHQNDRLLVHDGDVSFDVGPHTYTLTATSSVVVGQGSGDDATLRLLSGGVSNNISSIGSATGSNGAVFVTGADSTWTNSSNLVVGSSGTGELTVDGGGGVASNSGFIGSSAGSNGTVTVTGGDSAWTVNASLNVGFNGTGELSVEDGGTVSNGFAAFIGRTTGSTGTATVTGGESTWINSGDLLVGGVASAGGNGSLTVENDGTVSVGGELKIWDDGAVTRDGGQISTTDFTNRGTFDFHDGTLTVDGGVFENSAAPANLTLDGAAPGDHPELRIVNGAETQNIASLVVGSAGNFRQATLTIDDGGSFSSTGSGRIGLSSGSNGTVTVTGAGSTWTNSANISVGNSGTGTLTIDDGGSVSSSAGGIGTFSDAVGTVSVTGTDGDGNPSTWNSSIALSVGTSGTGELTVEDGAAVSSGTGDIGRNTGSQGTVTVTGAGSTWTNSSELFVGDSGAGELTIEGGGSVENTTSIIGNAAGSTGIVTVSGDDGNGNPSTWTNSSLLRVGESGSGTLTVENGGNLTAVGGFIGSSGGDGIVTVDGPGSTWTVFLDDVVVGLDGTGELAITAGGEVNIASSSSHVSIGRRSGSSGAVTVSGIGSTWTIDGFLSVGVGVFGPSTGTLDILDGGLVQNFRGQIALLSGSTGTVTVSGAGSTWMNSDSLDVGGVGGAGVGVAGGTGTLTVEIGATVDVGDTLTIWDDGTVNLFGGTINTGAVEFAGSTFNFTSGTLNITGTQAIDSEFLEKVLGPAPTITSGKQLLAAGPATLTQPLVLDGGILSFGQLVGAPLLELRRGTFNLTDQPVTVEAGGLLGGRLELLPNLILNVEQGVTNQGLIHGSGILGGPLVNTPAGEVRVEAGQTLTFTGPSADNSGELRLLGGIVDFHAPLTNAAGGRITGRGVLIARGGLDNQAHVALSSGISDVHGDVTNDTGDAAVGITVSGNADVTFWGDVTNTSGLLRVSANSSATFFGSFGGAGISGPGDVYFEADITPGSSPGLAEFGGNVHLGPLASLEIELAGTTKGLEYDAIDIAGAATLDGALNVSLIDGFSPGAGDVFEIIAAAGGITGTFTSELLPALAGDLFWNIDYGTNSVTLAVAAPGLPGDFNDDGIVNAADYTAWRDGLGSTFAPGDYDDWKSNFGATIGSGSGLTTSAAVPEPATAALALLGLFGLALGRRVRS